MLNLTRREKSVISVLVLLYITGSIIYLGKSFLKESKLPEQEKKAIVSDFKSRVKRVDSLYKDTSKESKVSKEFVPVNVNIANSQELQQIKGVGPVTANKIIEYRKIHGKFNSLEELKKVKGIGDKTLEKIKGEVTIE